MTRTEFLALILTATIGFSAGMNVMSRKQPDPQAATNQQPAPLPMAPTLADLAQPIQLASASEPLAPGEWTPIAKAPVVEATSIQLEKVQLESERSDRSENLSALGSLSLAVDASSKTRLAIRSATRAHQRRLQIIAHNLANVNTTAFKRDRLIVESSSYDRVRLAGQLDASGNPASLGIAYGQGIQIVGVETDFSQGAIMTTNDPLDLMIEGEGFFQVTDGASGEIYYSRVGNFGINANGDLVFGSTHESRLLEPAINIPPDATDIVISTEGDVQVRQPGSPDLASVGIIELATFINPQGLAKLGGNLYRENGASGPPTTGTAGLDGIGILRQHCLEGSNVEPADELFELNRTMRHAKSLQKLQASQSGADVQVLDIEIPQMNADAR